MDSHLLPGSHELVNRGASGITVKGDEKALAEALGLFDIGYHGYAGFELCHLERRVPISSGVAGRAEQE